jgi:AcrR family transcriptional regulator
MSPAARRAQLLEIGLDLLKTEPVENLTADMVARRAGVSQALVFHYFPTTRDLHLACLRQAANELFELIAGSLKVPLDEQLKKGLGAFVDYISTQPRTFISMSAVATSDPDFGQVFDEIRARIVEFIWDQVGGEMDSLNDLLVTSWTYSVEASVVRWFDDDTGVDRDQLIEALEEIIVPVLARAA